MIRMTEKEIFLAKQLWSKGFSFKSIGRQLKRSHSTIALNVVPGRKKERVKNTEKTCYCYTCDKYFHWIAINNHRKSHKFRNEDCKIRFTHGNIKFYDYSTNKITKKLCKRCGIEKDRNEFYKPPSKKGAYSYACKECEKSWARSYGVDYFQKNKENIKEKYRAYWREYNKNRVKAGLPRIKMLARSRLRDRVHRGKIIPSPCKVCGDLKVDGHHEDYSKPFDVTWLCKKHHTEVHNKKRQLERLKQYEKNK